METVFEVYATETIAPVHGMFSAVIDDNHTVRMDPGWSLRPYRHHNGGPSDPRVWTAKRIRDIRQCIGRGVLRDKELVTTISHTQHHDHWNKADKFIDSYPIITAGEIDRSNNAYIIPGDDDTIPLNDESTSTYEVGDWEIETIRRSHGALDGKNLGYVHMVHVQTPEGSVLHTSDVGGPQSRRTADSIIRRNPDVVFLDGPYESYIWKENGDWKNAVDHSKETLEEILAEKKASEMKRFYQSMSNMEYLVERLEGETAENPTIVMDHHAERAIPPGRRWKVKHLRERAREVGRSDVRIGTASDFVREGSPFAQIPLV